MKHRRGDQPDQLAYANKLGKLKSHQERLEYLSDIDEKFHDIVYLTSMQMGLAQTIANLPTREERKKAWDELPEHNATFEGMKNMVYHRVVNIFKNERS